MNNIRIRVALLENQVKQWELARLLGISETVLSRRLREELPEAEQDEIVKVIEEAKKA